jgi:predicted site-specific integrase-resolvase
MDTYSSREAARKLGITGVSLGRYIQAGKIAAPTHTVKAGPKRMYLWTEAEIEQVRQLLPKIANGRKTRYKKKQLAISNQQLAKPKKPKKK